jgi:diguanylate cyclase
VGVACLARLGGAVALNTASVVLLPPALIWTVLATAVPYLAVASFVSAIVMGTLLDRERRNLRAELSWQRSANTDPLTGLPNRRAFDRALRDVLSSSGPPRSCAILLVDVDHFKRVNDRHGHAVGDAALRFLADLLGRALPEGVRTCRIGGEEFAVVLPDLSDRPVRQAAEAIRRSVHETPFVHGGAELSLSVSIGIAMRQGREEIDAGMFLRAADVALYAAKAGGRNRVMVDAEPRCAGGRAAAALISQQVEEDPRAA